jgi:hypothetical protein
MDVRQLQGWLVEHGQPIGVDGVCGPQTRAAILAAFTNLSAPAVNDADIAAFAAAIGCTPKQIRAIAAVESAGGGFTNSGRPKILFERHYFYRLTGGRFGLSPWCNPKAGGYREDSWEKLCRAACLDPAAAFSSASWGKFQVMGAHWMKLDYRSPIAMAFSMTRSEADHYEALVRYIRVFGLADAARRLSTDPEDNRAFAKGYNGPGYARFDYHRKLARAMR